MRARSKSGTTGSTQELDAAVLRQSLRQVAGEYAHLNQLLFGGRLNFPNLGWLAHTGSALGQWRADSRRLELSTDLLEQGWGALVEVLKHEMAHQYVCEVLRVVEPPHGPAFREVCQARGIDGRASGRPENSGGSVGGPLEKVLGLLSLAERTSEHEAQAAMAAAQRLLLKHNLEEAVATASRGYCHRHLGSASGRIFEYSRIVALILGEHFFVETIWVPVWRPFDSRRGSVLEVCGTRDNVELAAYVHDYLHNAAELLWAQHKRERAIRGNRDRRDYLAGVMSGFRTKLDSQRSRAQQAGLVWQGDPELKQYLGRRHPSASWVRYGGRPISAARQQGHEAGQALVVRPGLSAAPTQATPKRLRPAD